jgi:putative phage-type endonuclease
MTRAEWLERRRQGLGASDAAAVLGLSPYQSPYSLFREKRDGVLVEEDDEVKEWGLLLEPAIAARYRQITGRSVTQPEPFTIVASPARPQFFCTPDAFVQVGDEACPLQFKVTAYFNPHGELPDHWQVQEQHEMLVTGASWASFGILVAGRKFYWADMPRNDAFCDLLQEKLEEFWDRVQRDNPPPLDGHWATTEALKRLYPRDNGSWVRLPAEGERWADELTEVKEELQLLRTRERGIENQIRAAIGDHMWGLLDNGGGGWSLKTTQRAAYAVEACEYRQLRRVDEKHLPKGLLA